MTIHNSMKSNDYGSFLLTYYLPWVVVVVEMGHQQGSNENQKKKQMEIIKRSCAQSIGLIEQAMMI